MDETALQDFGNSVREKLGFWGPDVIESAYPCSPVQQGILVSQSKDPNSYTVHGIWKICPATDEHFQPSQLEKAWQQVVAYHSMLRTVFVDTSRDNGLFDQIVLPSGTKAAVDMILMDKGGDPVQLLTSLTDLPPGNNPLVQPVICTTTDGDAYFSLRVNHALIDGASLGILMRDLQSAYHGTLHGSGPLYSDYITYIQTMPLVGALDYWKALLDTTPTCHFPDLSNSTARSLAKVTRTLPNIQLMRQFCRTHGVSIANIFQPLLGTGAARIYWVRQGLLRLSGIRPRYSCRPCRRGHRTVYQYARL